jgi:16S rRNA (guanine(966)-N(2))-methyltransferase RsmD
MPRHSAKPSKPAKVPVHRAPPPKQVRIIGGAWKRTPLPVLDALGLRPTPDRVRETVFNWINHLLDGGCENARVLDLFAGTGALGFEAASRGAQLVTMVDANAQVIRQLESIKDKLQADKVQVLRADAVGAAQSLAGRGQRYDLVFLDPPYNQELLAKSLPLCAGLLAPGALVYAEAADALPFAPQEGESVPAWLADWELVRQDKAGMVHFHLLRLRDRSK